MTSTTGDVPELSPLWGLVLSLAEIAARIERHCAVDIVTPLPPPVPSGKEMPAGVEPTGTERGR